MCVRPSGLAPFSAFVLALSLLVTPALGQTTTDAEARAEYDAGAAAYEAKSFARAATLFAHADELAPNPLVLKLGLAAATQADDALLGMTLVLRAEARAVDGSLADVARLARARFASRVGIVRVVCATRGGCTANLGGRRVADGQLIVVPPGDVDGMVEDGALRVHVHATAVARAIVDLVEPPSPAPPTSAIDAVPAPTSPPLDPSSGHPGLPSAIFWSGVVVTGVLGGATVASGVDTLAKHASFASDQSVEERARGVSAEARTNVLLGCTLGVAIVTGVIGLFFTRFREVDVSKAAWQRGDATILF